MQNSTKRVLILGLFSMLLISLVGFVAAESLADKAINNIAGSNSEVITSLFQGNLIDSPIVLRILFFMLITLLIYSVVSTFEFVKSTTISWVISVIIGLISVGFINNAMFMAIGQEYGVLGITMTAVLPFIILAFFTFNVAKTGKPTAILLESIIWWMFTIFLLTRFLFMDWTTTPVETKVIFAVIFLISLLIAILNNTITKAIMKKYRKAIIEKATDTGKKAVAREKTLAKEEEELGEERPKGED